MRQFGNRHKFPLGFVEGEKPPVRHAEIGAMQGEFPFGLHFPHIGESPQVLQRVEDRGLGEPLRIIGERLGWRRRPELLRGGFDERSSNGR